MSSVPREDPGPTFIEAMKEQLDIKVTKEEGSVNFFMVDNVEYPSEN